MRIAVELNRSSDMGMSRTQQSQETSQFPNTKSAHKLDRADSTRKVDAVKSITQSQEDLEKVGLATTTSFGTTANFRSIKFQRGANGAQQNIIDI